MGARRERVWDGEDVAENGSVKRYAEDEKPERDCEGGLGVRESPARVAPRKQGRRWRVPKVRCWEEDKNVKAGNNLLNLVRRRRLMVFTTCFPCSGGENTGATWETRQTGECGDDDTDA